MYHPDKTAERIEIANKQLGWNLEYHSIDEVDKVIKGLNTLLIYNDDGTLSGDLKRPFTDREKRWIRNERMLSACDAHYWLTRYAYIKTEEAEVRRFAFREPQKVYFNVIAELEAREAAIQLQILKARQLGMCLIPDTLILMSNFKWKKLDDVCIGDSIIAVDEFPSIGSRRRLQVSTVEAKNEVYEPSFDVLMSDGSRLTATGQHRFLSDGIWKTVSDLRVGENIDRIPGMDNKQIISITPSATQRMIDLQTSSKTFIAEGFISHNSTITELLVTHRISFYSGVNAIIASARRQPTQIMSQMLFLAYDRMPYWLKPKWTRRVESDQGMLVFGGIESGVNFQHGAQQDGIGRGTTPTVLHVSEVASFSDAESLIEKSLFKAVHESPSVFMVLESTAEGETGWWAETWRTSRKKWPLARLYPLFLPWALGTDIYPKQTWLRTRPVPDGWRPKRYTLEMMARSTAFIKSQPVLTKVLGGDWEFPREQAWWWEVSYEEALSKGTEKGFLQEVPCVAGSTRISTEQGIIRIDSAQDAKECESGRILKHLPKGEKPTLLVETEDGRSIEVTGDHKIRISSGEWREAKDILIGDELKLSPPMFAKENYIAKWDWMPNCEMSVEITPEYGRFLGYFMGDGCFNSNTLEFAIDKKDEDVLSDILRLAEKFMGRVPPNPKTIGQMYRVKASSVRWFEVFKNLGLIRPKINSYLDRQDGWQRNVCVPECIWRSPKPVIKEFLSALFECDGHAYRDAARVNIFSKHEQFITDIQILLLGFGIRAIKASPEVKRVNYRGEEKIYTGRKLAIPAAQVNKFYEQIGFISDRKHNGGKRQKEQDVAKGNRYKYLVDKVKSVTPTGNVVPVFDIEVEGNHYFSANGIEVHNCDDIECFQSGYDSVFGRDLIADLNTRRKKEYKIYGIVGPGIEEHHEPYEEDFDWDKERRIVSWQGTKSKYSWEFIPIREDTIDEEDTETAEGKLLIFHEPRAGCDYTLGVDTAGGKGLDSTVISVWLKGKGNTPDIQVAEWSSNFVSHVEAYAFVVPIAAYYSKYMDPESVNREPLVVIENLAATGDTVITQIRKMGYSRLYKFGRYDDVKMSQKKLRKVGWFTTGWSRPMLIDGFVQSVKNSWTEINSPFLIHEMNKFEVHQTTTGKEKMEHSEDEHDDRIFAAAMGVYCAHDRELMIERGENRYVPVGENNKPRVDISDYNHASFLGDSKFSDSIRTTRDLESFLASERFM
jgi:hypothetical protein